MCEWPTQTTSASQSWSRLAQVSGSFIRYSSSGSRGVPWTSRNRLPPSVNRCVSGSWSR